MRQTVQTDDAPAAVGAYSQATTTDDLVFTAGQIPLTPAGDSLADRPVAEQAEQAVENLLGVLEAADCAPGNVLKTTIYLADIEDFETVDAVYADAFPTDPPARSAVGVEALPKGVALELEAIGRRE
jgi:reactive intermediate/imine deaminase